MRYGIIVLWMLFCSVTSAVAQVSIGIGMPGVSIGINLPVYPELVRVPGYPVYYAPRLQSNYFFYDGMYWVYQDDNWYASSWYNGPWALVAPEFVPLFVLRIPVRYYPAPPVYFRRWRADAPPRWGEHWGNDWERNRRGWDKWNRRSVPAPAPLPVYQRRYSGDRYPHIEQQHQLRSQNYRYRPRDAIVRRHYQEQAVQRAPERSQRGQSGPGRQDIQRSSPPPLQQRGPAVPRSQSQQKGEQKGGEEFQRRSTPTQVPARQSGAAVQEQRQRPLQGEARREQQRPRSGPENIQDGRPASLQQQPRRGQGQEKRDRDRDHEKGEERDRDRNR